jgi:hypothetical protein
MSPLVAPAHTTSGTAVLPAAHKVGSFVRVTRGPLAGLTGRLLDSPESGRCLIEVSLLGNGIYLRIDPGLLESVRE